MYDDYEGPSSSYLAFKGLFAIIVIIAVLCGVYLFITKLRRRKLSFTINDIAKLIWMIASVIILILMMSLFVPEFSINAANRKFSEFLPFQNGFLGAVTALVAAFVVSMFCVLGIGTYFEKPKKMKTINMTIEEEFKKIKHSIIGDNMISFSTIIPIKSFKST
jgi:hypothetical protein